MIDWYEMIWGSFLEEIIEGNHQDGQHGPACFGRITLKCVGRCWGAVIWFLNHNFKDNTKLFQSLWITGSSAVRSWSYFSKLYLFPSQFTFSQSLPCVVDHICSSSPLLSNIDNQNISKLDFTTKQTTRPISKRQQCWWALQNNPESIK